MESCNMTSFCCALTEVQIDHLYGQLDVSTDVEDILEGLFCITIIFICFCFIDMESEILRSEVINIFHNCDTAECVTWQH